MTTEAALLTRAGDAGAARKLLEQLGSATTDEGVLAVARVHLLLGDPTSAAAIRAGIAPAAHVRGRVTAAVLDALLAAASGDEDRASEHIEDALAAAAPWSLRRPLLTDSAPLQPLLQRRIESGSVVPAFALDLLERISGASPTHTEVRRALIDPLTDRERTVLRYLTSSLSTAEIATELYLSINTVKTHQRTLYRKLDARGRRDAVHRARQLRLWSLLGYALARSPGPAPLAGRTRGHPVRADSPLGKDPCGGRVVDRRDMRHGEPFQRMEYRVLEVRESLVGGRLSGDELEEILNDEARKGWRLKSITHADVKGRIGPGAVEGLILTFERPVG